MRVYAKFSIKIVHHWQLPIVAEALKRGRHYNQFSMASGVRTTFGNVIDPEGNASDE